MFSQLFSVSVFPSIQEEDLIGVLNNIAERMAFWFKDL